MDFNFSVIFFFQPVHNADFIVPVEIDGTIHQVITIFWRKAFLVS